MDKIEPTEPFFFIIDSEHLDLCKSASYGYVINDDVITEYPPSEYMSLSGHGCYVVVTKTEDEIIISQDFIGSYGIYIFRDKNGGFVIGNSFLYLLEYLNRKGESLTFNRDYANYYITTSVCSSAFDQTMINEIFILDRSTRLHINIGNADYYAETIDYGENRVDPATKEGIELLDRWFYSWVDILRSIGSRTTNIRADLSGGFDSRTVFSLVYKSGLDLNKIWVCSTQDGKQTHAEDLIIASEIAEELHFPLNNHRYQSDEKIPYDIKEILSKSLYVKLFFHKHMYYHQGYFKQTSYHLTGFGGECVRNYPNLKPEVYIEEQKERAVHYCNQNDSRLSDSVEIILRDSIKKTCEKLEAAGISFTEEELLRYHYRETRCRNHFGKNTVENFLSNRIVLSPLLDPKLHRLKASSAFCEDPDFLIALILSRYAPELLGFEFEGGREISKETLAKADAVNLRFPFRKMNVKRVECCSAEDNTAVSKPSLTSLKKADEIVQGAFECSYVKKSIEWEFSGKAYEAALRRSKNENQHCPLADVYGMVGIPKLLQDIGNPDNDISLMPDWLIQIYSMHQFSESTWNSSSAPLELQKSFREFHISCINNVSNGIEICWEIIDGLTGYVVYRKNKGKTEKIADLNKSVSSFVDCEVQKSWGRVFEYCVCPKYLGYQKPLDEWKTIQRLSEVSIRKIGGNGHNGLAVRVFCDRELNKSTGYEIEFAESKEDLLKQKGSFKRKRVDGRDNTWISISVSVKRKMYFRVRGYAAYVNGKTGIKTISYSNYSPVAALDNIYIIRLENIIGKTELGIKYLKKKSTC